MIKLLITDDHKIFIEGLISIFENIDDIEVLDYATSGRMLFNKLHQHDIDVLVLDIAMPELNGIELLERIGKEYPKLKILMLTMHMEATFITSALKKGASGYVLKGASSEEFIEAVRTVHRGDVYFSKGVSEIVIQNLTKRRRSTQSVYFELTKRETEIVRYVAKGYTSDQIASKLFVSINTVKTHRKNIYSKLQINNMAELTKFAMENNLLD